MNKVKKSLILGLICLLSITLLFPTAAFAAIPDAPDNLDAIVESDSEIFLEWDEVDDAEKYYIYRSKNSTSTSNFKKIATTNDPEYTDSGLSANTKYYYMVKAHSDDGTSDYSSKKYATTYALATPQNLEATADGTDTIDLTWNAVVGADDYYIYRAENSTDPDDFDQVGDDPVAGTSYSDTGLTAGTKYYYKIKAHKTAGNGFSNYSAYDDATTAE